MEVRALRCKLRMLGFGLYLAGDGLRVVPASILMPELREGIRQHRAALIDDVLAHPDLPCRCIDCGAVLPAPYKWRCPDCLAAMGVK